MKQSRLQITGIQSRLQINTDAEQTTDHRDIEQTADQQRCRADYRSLRYRADCRSTQMQSRLQITEAQSRCRSAEMQSRLKTTEIQSRLQISRIMQILQTLWSVDAADKVDTRAYWQIARIDQEITCYVIYRRTRRAMIIGKIYPGLAETTSSPAGNRGSDELLRDSLDLWNADQIGNRYNRFMYANKCELINLRY